MKATRLVRCTPLCPLLFALVMAAWTTACGGAPDSFSYQDSTGTVLEGNAASLVEADAMAPDAMTLDPVNACVGPAEGCPCAEEGQIVDCQTIKFHTGNYTTCTPGKRECKDGVWGACIGKTVYAH